jgi:signal peptidase II
VKKAFILPVSIITVILTLDQLLKFWVKLSFHYTEHLEITPWFYLYFIENEGMAFGLSWGGEYGKLALTLFRLVASVVIFYWLYRAVITGAHKGLIICISLIFAGAVGNIIDSVFYGLIFSESTPETLATLFPKNGGYAPLLHGHVVDMLYFPLWEGFLPEWIPVWGGEYFVFFQAIFNIADASISTGIISIIVFQKWLFKEAVKQEQSISIQTTPQDTLPEGAKQNTDTTETNS